MIRQTCKVFRAYAFNFFCVIATEQKKFYEVKLLLGMERSQKLTKRFLSLCENSHQTAVQFDQDFRTDNFSHRR